MKQNWVRCEHGCPEGEHCDKCENAIESYLETRATDELTREEYENDRREAAERRTSRTKG